MHCAKESSLFGLAETINDDRTPRTIRRIRIPQKMSIPRFMERVYHCGKTATMRFMQYLHRPEFRLPFGVFALLLAGFIPGCHYAWIVATAVGIGKISWD